jgi:hypothetical protein
MALKVGNVVVIDDNRKLVLRSTSTATAGVSLSINSDLFDEYIITAQDAALTINADTGSPVDGQRLIIRIKDNSIARALALTTGSTKSYRAIGITLPTTTIANKTLYIGMVYNSADQRWDVLAANSEI